MAAKTRKIALEFLLVVSAFFGVIVGLFFMFIWLKDVSFFLLLGGGLAILAGLFAATQLMND